MDHKKPEPVASIWTPLGNDEPSPQHILVAASETDEGVPAVRKLTRERVGTKWEPVERWVDPWSGRPIGFEPKFWRPNPAWYGNAA